MKGLFLDVVVVVVIAKEEARRLVLTKRDTVVNEIFLTRSKCDICADQALPRTF